MLNQRRTTMENDMLDNAKDCSEECDCNSLKKQIADVLRKYFQYNDCGEPNDAYDPDFAPQDALDEIHEIIGDI